MTPQQKAWLDANPKYEIIRPGGLGQSGERAATPNASMTRARYTSIGAVKPDGTFVENAAPEHAGEMAVGIFQPSRQLTPHDFTPLVQGAKP